MTAEQTLPFLIWPISCFDRRKANPLPVSNRFFYLDCAQLPPEQADEIIALIREKEKDSASHSPLGLGDVVITMSIGGASRRTQQLERAQDALLFKYRNKSSEVPNNDINVLFGGGAAPIRTNIRTVSYSTEYFENEQGNPITKIEMFQHVTGNESPILMGEPDSIIRLGPAVPLNRNEWTVEKANIIAQFLDVVERILASGWATSPKSITSRNVKSPAESETLEALFPDDRETMSILAYFRQLHAGDKLVSRACEVYLRHSSHPLKNIWVRERKTTFEGLVDTPPGIFDGIRDSRRSIVRMFMYGARLLHSGSDSGDDNKLQEFINRRGRLNALFIFNSCLMDFFRVAWSIYPVIKQDYDHWTKKEGLESPNRLSIDGLFSGFRKPPPVE